MGDATGYSSEYGYQLYEVTGATEDWNYVAQNAFGYTIELGGEPGSPVFHGPHQSYVVDQYLGTPGTPTEGRGVREALLLARRAGRRRPRPRDRRGVGPRRPHAPPAQDVPHHHEPDLPDGHDRLRGQLHAHRPRLRARRLPRHAAGRARERPLRLARRAVHPAVRAQGGPHGELGAQLRGPERDGRRAPRPRRRHRLDRAGRRLLSADDLEPARCPADPGGPAAAVRDTAALARPATGRPADRLAPCARTPTRRTRRPAGHQRTRARGAGGAPRRRRRLLASGRRARVTRRARITLRFRRTPTAGTYRLEVRAVDSRGLPVRGVARLIVRR